MDCCLARRYRNLIKPKVKFILRINGIITILVPTLVLAGIIMFALSISIKSDKKELSAEEKEKVNLYNKLGIILCCLGVLSIIICTSVHRFYLKPKLCQVSQEVGFQTRPRIASISGIIDNRLPEAPPTYYVIEQHEIGQLRDRENCAREYQEARNTRMIQDQMQEFGSCPPNYEQIMQARSEQTCQPQSENSQSAQTQTQNNETQES